jgi:hypothetical protein
VVGASVGGNQEDDQMSDEVEALRQEVRELWKMVDELKSAQPTLRPDQEVVGSYLQPEGILEVVVDGEARWIQVFRKWC